VCGWCRKLEKSFRTSAQARQRALAPANAEKSNVTSKESKLTELDFRACLRKRRGTLSTHKEGIPVWRERARALVEWARGLYAARIWCAASEMYFLNRQTCFSEKSLPCTQRKRVIFIYCVVCFKHNANTIFVSSFLCQCVGVHQQTESRWWGGASD